MAAQTSQSLLKELRQDIAELRHEVAEKADREDVAELQRTIRGYNGTPGLTTEVARIGDRLDRLSQAVWAGVGAFVLGIIGIILERIFG